MPLSERRRPDTTGEWELHPAWNGPGELAVHRVRALALVPPGVPVDEVGDDRALLRWREACWPDTSALARGAPAVHCSPIAISALLDRLPASAEGWAEQRTREQLARMRWLVAHLDGLREAGESLVALERELEARLPRDDAVRRRRTALQDAVHRIAIAPPLTHTTIGPSAARLRAADIRTAIARASDDWVERVAAAGTVGIAGWASVSPAFSDAILRLTARPRAISPEAVLAALGAACAVTPAPPPRPHRGVVRLRR